MIYSYENAAGCMVFDENGAKIDKVVHVDTDLCEIVIHRCPLVIKDGDIASSTIKFHSIEIVERDESGGPIKIVCNGMLNE